MAGQAKSNSPFRVRLPYHQVLLLCVLLLAALLLGGCTLDATLPCPGPTEQVVDPGPGDDTVAFTLQNNTCMTICRLYITPDQCEYVGGNDRLAGQPLHSGETFTTYVVPGKYFAWMEYCTEETMVMEHLKVNSDSIWTLSDPDPDNTPPCSTSLTVVNNVDVPICSMYLGITESVYTGWNWIGDQPIPVGESFTLMLKPRTYFVRAEACDGTWLRAEVDVPLSGHQNWTVP